MIPQFDILPADQKINLQEFKHVFVPADKEWLDSAKHGLVTNQNFTPIFLVEEDEVRKLIVLEKRVIKNADFEAHDNDEFEESLNEFENTDEFQNSDFSYLEIGVGSLIIALSHIGGMPLTGCRCHNNYMSYSQMPMVCVKTDFERVMAINNLINNNNLFEKFELDGETKEEALIIMSKSVLDLVELAELIMNNKDIFKNMPLPIFE